MTEHTPEYSVRIAEKVCLTVPEASLYSGIGRSTLYRLLNEPGCTFVLNVGRKKLIKRKIFERFIEQQNSL